MWNKTKTLFRRLAAHRYGITLLAYLAAATITGGACVLFMRGFEWTLEHRLDWREIGAWAWIVCPALFLVSVELVRRAAPWAAGTGIPQVVFGASRLTASNEPALRPLYSFRTMSVKILALFLALAAGASTGREGPTVHVAACLFIGILLLVKKITGFSFDIRSAAVAGGAAGLAAAFNTPLAGVTFAVEELVTDAFGTIKDFVILAIVVAALAAKSLTGEYAYFGRLLEPPAVPAATVVFVGLLCGMLGAFFSSALLWGAGRFGSPSRPAWRYVTPCLFSLAILGIAAGTRIDAMGPGNHAAQTLVLGNFDSWSFSFPFAKMGATLLTYWSGAAGGIFAPSLSIGAALGANAGHVLGSAVASCALVGMAGFLSGTIQAPITSFVIIFEMTGHHGMLIPIMLASLVAYMVARVLRAPHFYQTLANRYSCLLDGKA